MFKMAKKILSIDGKPSMAGSSSGQQSSGSNVGNVHSKDKNKSKGEDMKRDENLNASMKKTDELDDFTKLKEDPRLPMNKRQIFKITKSWKAIARATGRTGTIMFLNLFEQNEDLFYLFDRFQHLKRNELQESMELRDHAATVMETLDHSISSLNDYDNFVRYLHSIGQMHRKIPDFKREHFWKIEDPFMKAVKQTLDERCNDAIEEIYRIAIKLIIETIAEGYSQDYTSKGETSQLQSPPTAGGNAGGTGGGSGTGAGNAGNQTNSDSFKGSNRDSSKASNGETQSGKSKPDKDNGSHGRRHMSELNNNPNGSISTAKDQESREKNQKLNLFDIPILKQNFSFNEASVNRNTTIDSDISRRYQNIESSHESLTKMSKFSEHSSQTGNKIEMPIYNNNNNNNNNNNESTSNSKKNDGNNLIVETRMKETSLPLPIDINVISNERLDSEKRVKATLETLKGMLIALSLKGTLSKEGSRSDKRGLSSNGKTKMSKVRSKSSGGEELANQMDKGEKEETAGTRKETTDKVSQMEAQSILSDNLKVYHKSTYIKHSDRTNIDTNNMEQVQELECEPIERNEKTQNRIHVRFHLPSDDILLKSSNPAGTPNKRQKSKESFCIRSTKASANIIESAKRSYIESNQSKHFRPVNENGNEIQGQKEDENVSIMNQSIDSDYENMVEFRDSLRVQNKSTEESNDDISLSSLSLASMGQSHSEVTKHVCDGKISEFTNAMYGEIRTRDSEQHGKQGSNDKGQEKICHEGQGGSYSLSLDDIHKGSNLIQKDISDENPSSSTIDVIESQHNNNHQNSGDTNQAVILANVEDHKLITNLDELCEFIKVLSLTISSRYPSSNRADVSSAELVQSYGRL